MKSAYILRVLFASSTSLCAIAWPARAQTNPVYVGSITGCVPAATTDHFLYTFCPGGSLKIFDISNPTNAVDTGYSDTETCQALTISGAYAYEVNYSSLNILSISSPTNPVVIGHVDGAWQGVEVADNYVYLAGNGSAASAIVDATDPANPVVTGYLPGAESIAVSGGYAYLPTTYTNSPGLGVYDISNRANPIMVAFVRSFWGNALPAFQLDTLVKVEATGNYLCATGYGRDYRTIWLFDISTRTNPVPVNRLADHYYQGPDFPQFCYMAVSGNYLYTVGDPLSVYDITDPANAYAVASLQLSSGEYGRTLIVHRSFAYVAQYGQVGVFALDLPAPPLLEISPPTADTLLLSWPTPSAAFAVQQSPTLNPPNWTTVTDRSIVVAGRNQVVLPAPTGPMFYRLVSE